MSDLKGVMQVANSILSAPQAQVNSSERTTASHTLSAVPITITWQSDRNAPGYGVCLLESLQLFNVLVTKHGVEVSHCVAASFDGGIWTVTVRQLTELHKVAAWNEACAISISGVAR